MSLEVDTPVRVRLGKPGQPPRGVVTHVYANGKDVKVKLRSGDAVKVSVAQVTAL